MQRRKMTSRIGPSALRYEDVALAPLSKCSIMASAARMPLLSTEPIPSKVMGRISPAASPISRKSRVGESYHGGAPHDRIRAEIPGLFIKKSQDSICGFVQPGFNH